MGLNPITLKYYSNLKGQKLRQKERQAEIRRILRAKNLELQNCPKFDIINGYGKDLVRVPGDILDKYKHHILNPKRTVRVYKYEFHI